MKTEDQSEAGREIIHGYINVKLQQKKQINLLSLKENWHYLF
jgi:hypothetical protein